MEKVITEKTEPENTPRELNQKNTGSRKWSALIIIIIILLISGYYFYARKHANTVPQTLANQVDGGLGGLESSTLNLEIPQHSQEF